MPELTREEKLKLLEKLPQQLQDFLYSEDTGAFLLYFGQKYNLPDEKIRLLSKLVADVVLGITPITSLSQEIVNKITPDHQIAMAIAQELNSELIAPILMPAQATPPIPVVPATPPAPIAPSTPIAPPRPVYQPAAPQTPLPKTDQYREPMREAPEIIDLRKTPPPPMPMPVAAAPAYIPPPKPLTFTKPVEKPLEPVSMPHLIEADPHHVEPLKTIPEERPQFIIRPPGLAPTDLPHDVLDLRKDKGEF